MVFKVVWPRCLPLFIVFIVLIEVSLVFDIYSNKHILSVASA